ncbi:ROK family protein [Pedobacter hiemivivus]|uniref:ROK family protein n=1 Tax=Pedobacter hiemivivus TaxID=2530454 RepID=A0A4R0MYY4_9SPHI|nr:ROK family protein [Pedobacter hiemivivus]TCC92505.1 ROK family protein [Pedobacter hiemivivus]
MNLNTALIPFIGVDIGGSHITAAYIDSSTYHVIPDSLKRERVASEAAASIIFDSWVEALSPLIAELPVDQVKIGVAMPGPFDYKNGIALFKNVKKYDSLYGLDVGEILSDKLNIPRESIIFINDAEAFLIGEMVAGAAADVGRAIGITLGTGLGSASNCSGKVVDVNRAALPFLEQHAEEYISTRWLLTRYKELTGKEVKNVEDLLNSATPALKNQIFDEFATNLASFLNDFIADENPEVLVIGGNIARTWDHFMPQLQQKIVNKNVMIRQTEMWEDAALVGAACIWINQQ